MHRNKITAHAIDIVAVLAALPIAVPFLLLVIAPFVSGL